VLPPSHLDRQEKQAQPYSLFLRKYCFPKTQISSRAYIDIEVSKYHKIFLGKIIFWLRVLQTFGAICKKNCKIGNYEGAGIWLKQALDREFQLQKYFVSPNLLSTSV